GTGDDNRNLPVMPQWAGNLPEEITGNEAARNILMQHKEGNAKIEVPVGLVKSYIDAKRAVSGMVTIPAENATAEQKAAFNKKTGVPDKAEDYSLKVPDGAPAELFKDDQIDAFKKDAHELGVPKGKAEELFNRFAGRQIETYNGMMSTNQQGQQESFDALKKELGNDFDATVKSADQAAAWADPEMFNVIHKAGLANHPVIVKGFGKVAKALGEGMLKGVGPGVPTVALTKQELEVMMRDPKYKLAQGDPVGEEWRAKVTAGFEQLYPGSSGGDIAPSSGRSLHGA
ncbi:hypothetical protein LCGC14_2310880, partial [marine sediment metagenome]